MSVTFPLEKVKYIDRRTKAVVSGFLRKEQMLLPQNNLFILHDICLLYYRDGINTKILTPHEQSRFFDLLHENSKFQFNEFGYLLWKLLYRGTSDGFEYDTVVKHCFNRKHIVCFIHTECGHIIGGYTSIGYKHDILDEKVRYTKDKKAFVMRLRSPSKTEPMIADIRVSHQQYATATRHSFYFIFGSGWDIYCTPQQLGRVYPAAYHWPDFHLRQFSVKEIEVFQLK